MIHALAMLLLSGAAVGPDHWPRWRGPAGTGSAPGANCAASFSSTKNVAWKVALPGKGCSTPVVWGDRIVLTAPVDGQDGVLCVDLGGKELWRVTAGKAVAGKHKNGSAANPSAATDGKRVFAYFKSGNLAGLDLETGKLLWRTNLDRHFGKYKVFWDLGTSPVLTEKCVIVAVMHSGDSGLVAFEKETGRVAWRVARDFNIGSEVDHSYTTPIVYRQGGAERILVWGGAHLTVHDPADGRVLWTASVFDPAGRGNWVAVGSPVIIEDLAVVSYGRGKHLQAVRLGGAGEVTKSHRAWDVEGVGAFVPTLAAHAGRVYVLTMGGVVTCVDPTDGSTAWSEKLPKGRGKYYASPTIAGGTLYAARDDGVVMTGSIAGGTFSLIGENDMGERIIASPVPVGETLLIRGEKNLFCIRAR